MIFQGASDKINKVVEGLFADNDEQALLDALKVSGITTLQDDAFQPRTLVSSLQKGTTQSMVEILSNTHAGEQNEEKFFVFMKNNAVLRLDVRVRTSLRSPQAYHTHILCQVWRYNFEGQNVMANKENVFCCKSQYSPCYRDTYGYLPARHCLPLRRRPQEARAERTCVPR